jgi:hypothetical protein
MPCRSLSYKTAGRGATEPPFGDTTDARRATLPIAAIYHQDIDFAIDFSECSWRGLRDSDMAINSLSLIDRRGALGG